MQRKMSSSAASISGNNPVGESPGSGIRQADQNYTGNYRPGEPDPLEDEILKYEVDYYPNNKRLEYVFYGFCE